MPQVAINGQAAPTNTASFTAGDPVYTTATLPIGRVGDGGRRHIIITGILLYMGGGGTAQLWCDTSTNGALGPIAGSGLIPIASGVSSTGWRTVRAPQRNANGSSIRIGWNASSGSKSFGRSSAAGRRIEDGYGGWADQTLAGQYGYIQVATEPRNLTATATASTSVTLSWAGPTDDGGTPVTDYLVQCSRRADFATLELAEFVTTKRTWTGLAAGVTFYWRVFARNAVYEVDQALSQVSNVASATTGSSPTAPRNLAATLINGVIGLTWDAPESTNGSAILDYRVHVSTSPTFATFDEYVSSATVRSKAVPGLDPDTTYYVHVWARNSVGRSPDSNMVSVTTPPRTMLDYVTSAATMVGGTLVSIRHDGAIDPAPTLGYTVFGSDVFVPITTIPATGARDPGFALTHTGRSLALASDDAGNLYVVGARTGDTSRVLVHKYRKSGATSWVLEGALSQPMPAHTDPLAQFAATWVAGRLFILGRRASMTGATVYAIVDPAANFADRTGALFASYGNDPTWLAEGAGNRLAAGLDVTTLPNNRVAIAANGYAIVQVALNDVIGVAKAATGSVYNGRAIVLATGASSFVAIYITDVGDLRWTFYGTTGTLLGSGTLPAARAYGGAFAAQWGAFYDTAAGQVVIDYIGPTERRVESVRVSPVTYAASTAVVITSTLGPAGSINGPLRIATGTVDERRVVLEVANRDTDGNIALYAVGDEGGNAAPNAPTLATFPGYDATEARALSWAFSDRNPLDVQSAADVEVQRVSDAVLVVSATTAAARTYTIAANTLTNGDDYRWRIRTYDVLGKVSAWSAWAQFTASALGTLTITSPAEDNPAGLEFATYAVEWAYHQADGYVQSRRRVRTLVASSRAVLSDTGMVATTSPTYLVTGLPSDVEVEVEVTVQTNAPGSPTIVATRRITASYSRPMTPTATLITGATYIEVRVDNPIPTGSRPEVARNAIDRRSPGSASWETVALVPRGGSYRDHAVASGARYDYRVRGIVDDE